MKSKSLEIVPFRIVHMSAFDVGSAICGRAMECWLADMRELDGAPGCWTLRSDRVLVCAGTYQSPGWPTRAVAWAFVRPDIPLPALLFATRTARNLLRDLLKSGVQRIETTVIESFVAGHKWAALLGLESEGILHRYDPMGRDHRMYAIWHQQHPSSQR